MSKYYLIIIFLLIAFVSSANAEYYEYVDEHGNVSITDNPENIPENIRTNIKTIIEPINSPSRVDNKMSSNAYNEKMTCPPETKEQAKKAIKETWVRMASAMVSGNYEKAISYFLPGAREDIKTMLSKKSKEEINRTFSDYEAIEVNILYEDDGVAEAGVIRKEKSGTYSYPVAFRKVINCKWQIRGF